MYINATKNIFKKMSDFKVIIYGISIHLFCGISYSIFYTIYSILSPIICLCYCSMIAARNKI